jgi:hypothetical protein
VRIGSTAKEFAQFIERDLEQNHRIVKRRPESRLTIPQSIKEIPWLMSVRTVRVDDTLEMGCYIDDCTDPWKAPETIVMLTGNHKPRLVYYGWMPTLARDYRL